MISIINPIETIEIDSGGGGGMTSGVLSLSVNGGPQQVGNVSISIPTSAGDILAAPADHNHDDRYYTKSGADGLFVSKTGNETVNGVKNFTSRPTVNGTGVLLSGESGGGVGPYPEDSGTYVYFYDSQTGYAFWEYGDAIPASVLVYTTGNQSISGVKSFASRPNVGGTPVLLSGEGGSTIDAYTKSQTDALLSGKSNTGHQHAISDVVNLQTSLDSKLSITGGSMSGRLVAAADNTSPKLNMGAPVSVTAPANYIGGDVWINNLNKLNWATSSSNYITAAGLSQSNTFNQAQAIGTVSVAASLGISNGGTGPAITALANGTGAAVRITQQGAGEAFRVEDETTPDSTAFVISNSGRVGIGVTPDASAALSVDAGGIKFSDGTIQTTATSASPISNVVYTTGNQTISGVKNFTSRPTVNGTGVLLSGEVSAGSSISRGTASVSISSIPASGTVNATVDFGCKSYGLLSVSTTSGAWVRLYYDTTSRTNDASRTIDQDPASNVSLMAESLSTSSSAVRFAPSTIGYNEGNNTSIPIALTNTRNITASYNVVFNFLKLEL